MGMGKGTTRTHLEYVGTNDYVVVLSECRLFYIFTTFTKLPGLPLDQVLKKCCTCIRP